MNKFWVAFWVAGIIFNTAAFIVAASNLTAFSCLIISLLGVYIILTEVDKYITHLTITVDVVDIDYED